MKINIQEKALKVLNTEKVAIFVVAYNAEKHIEKVLTRIPPWISEKLTEIFIIDDSSVDKTVETAKAIQWPAHFAPLKVFKTPTNQGYGGNQRLGNTYAIERGFDIVVMLHGDGQYAPEALPEIIAAYDDGADAVYGSRFLDPMGALKGKMPLYKFIGNRILTYIQNLMIGAKLSEWHSGYRSYRTRALKLVPFKYNSQGFDFDADIIVQFIARGLKIIEVPIPTYYGDEICHVNGLDYAQKCIKTCLKYCLMKFELLYDPKFDFQEPRFLEPPPKLAATSLHHFVRSLDPEGSKVLELSAEGSVTAYDFALKGAKVTYLNSSIKDFSHPMFDVQRGNLDELHFSRDDFDVVIALSALGTVKSPEAFAQNLYRSMRSGGKLYASFGNIAFWMVRLNLVLGLFNYGRRGILDMRHSRLFTVGSAWQLLERAGFKINFVRGFGPPIADLRPKNSIFALLDSMTSGLARLWPRLFAFEILIEATRLPDVFANFDVRSQQEDLIPTDSKVQFPLA